MMQIKKIWVIAVLVFVLPMIAAQGTQTPDIQVDLLAYEPSPVQPGQVIDVTIQVSNLGERTTHVWLEIIEEYPFTVLDSQDIERARSLSVSSGTQNLQFRIQVDEAAKDSITPLRIKFGRGQNKEVFQEKEFDIIIETFDSLVDVTHIQQMPERLEPGQEGNLILQITNRNDRPIANVDVLLDLTSEYDIATVMNNMLSIQSMINARLEDVNRRVASGQSPLSGATPMMQKDATQPAKLSFQAFAPVDGSTLKRVGTLEAGESKTLTYKMRALPEAKPNIYATPIYINYNDEDNNPFHIRFDVALSVDSPTDTFIELGPSTLRSTDFAGKITIIIANQGLSNIQFASVHLKEGEEYRLLTSPRSVYLGTLAPGKSSEAVFEIIPKTEELDLPIVLTYRDAFNNKIAEEKNLHLEIINKNYYRDMPYETLVVWIILGAVVFALSLYFFIMIRKRAS